MHAITTKYIVYSNYRRVQWQHSQMILICIFVYQMDKYTYLYFYGAMIVNLKASEEIRIE